MPDSRLKRQIEHSVSAPKRQLKRRIPRIRKAVNNAPLVVRFRRWAGRIKPPGFGGLTLHEVALSFFGQIRVSQLNVRSAAVTYNFLMAIPPTLLILFSLVPYLPLNNVQDLILNAIPVVFNNPGVSEKLQQIIVDFMNTERRSLLSFGILLTAFFSSNGMMGLMRSFDQQSPVYKKRTGLQRRWMAIKLTFILLATVIIAVAGMLLQARFLKPYILRVIGGPFLLNYATPIAIGLVVFLTICIIYRYAPSFNRKHNFVSAGAVLATVLCLLATVVFFYLVDNFIQYNKVYGSVGTIIAFMAWMYLNTFIILIGFELNVSILVAVHNKDLPLTKTGILPEKKPAD